MAMAVAMALATTTSCKMGEVEVSGTVNEIGGGTTTASTGNPVSAISFPGIATVDQISGSTMRLNWTHISGAQQYFVYNTTSGAQSYITTITAPTATYTVTGLSPATTYKFRVRMMDSTGSTDTNTNDATTTTLTITATWAGWTHAQSVGPTTPTSGSSITAGTASVTLTWNAMTLSSGSVASYSMYRSTTQSGTYTLQQSGINAATRSYTQSDPNVTADTSYWYKVKPVVGVTEIEPVSATDAAIHIIVPTSNMVFVNRWIANQEVCGLMGRAVSRDNNYRCDYTGPGKHTSGDYYDIGGNYIIDRFEMGCNYTKGVTCGGADCIGSASPPAAGLGSDGNIYYSRQSGNCYLKAAGAWTAANAIASDASRASLASNSPGLPPLVVIAQANSYNVCAQKTAGSYGAMKLPSRKVQIAAGAWSSALSDATIATTENGTSINTSHNCNTNSGSGLTYDNLATPTDLETLPGCLNGDCSGTANTIKSVRTGGTSTTNCVSRYGAQDMVGNVYEWLSDQLGACIAGTTWTCAGAASGLDATNTDFQNYHYTGANDGAGPGGQSITSFDMSVGSYSATRFIIPLGLPAVGGANAIFDSFLLTATVGAGNFDPAKLHGDYMYLYTQTANASRGALGGGSWTGGARNGRFFLALDVAPALTYYGIGLRCASAPLAD